MDYIGIAVLLIYATSLRLFALSWLQATGASLLAVLGPLGLYVCIYGILHQSLAGFFTPAVIITTLLQLLTAYLLFRKLQAEEESYAAWIGYGLVGGMLLYFAIPGLVGRLV